MTFGSCRFFFCQFFQRNKADAIVLDVDALAALAAGFVGCLHIDGLHQFPQGIRVKGLNPYILVRLLDELFNVVVLAFLCLNLLPQSDDLGLQLLLLRLIVLAQHIETFIVQPPAGVVL